jgi:hypothetical protein
VEGFNWEYPASDALIHEAEVLYGVVLFTFRGGVEVISSKAAALAWRRRGKGLLEHYGALMLALLCPLLPSSSASILIRSRCSS